MENTYIYHEHLLPNGKSVKFLWVNEALFCHGTNVHSVFGHGNNRYTEIPENHKYIYETEEKSVQGNIWLTPEGSLLQFQGRESCLRNPEKTEMFLDYLYQINRLKTEGPTLENEDERDRISEALWFLVNFVQSAPEGYDLAPSVESLLDQLVK